MISDGREIILEKIEFQKDCALFFIHTDVSAIPENDVYSPPIPTPSDEAVSFSARLFVDGAEIQVKPYSYKDESGKWLITFKPSPIPANFEKIVLEVIQEKVWRFEIEKEKLNLKKWY